VSVLVLLGTFPAQTQARPTVTMDTRTPQPIQLVIGESLVIESAAQITRLSLAAPEIADAVVLSPQQFYITGKTVGATHLTLWDTAERVMHIFAVQVTANVTRLEEKLHEILPTEDIQVTATHDTVTLYGRVSSTAQQAQALALASAFMPEKPEKVINLLQVGGTHQVMLEVRVAEISRALTRRLNFNFSILAGASTFGLSLLNNLTSLSALSTAGGSPGDLTLSPRVNALSRFRSGSVSVTHFIDALKENGLVKILAEPTLVTLSGQEASFLAGGEFPIPVPQRSETITIQFKTFGVGLVFTPTVLSQNRISLRVAPEVSELDFTNAVNFSGFVIPGLITRRAAAVVELADGQSLALAGLLQESVRESISKFPVLGDVPILGALFRSSQFQKNETELMIIVTPRLVQPLNMAKQTLPTDQFVEPNDVEFYLLGKMAGQGQTGRRSGQLDGKFGPIIP